MGKTNPSLFIGDHLTDVTGYVGCRTMNAEASASNPTSPSISGETTMSDLLQAYPGAQRALFAQYHIGGCQSCAFQPQETLAQVCERNENLPVDEVIEHIVRSHDADASIQISPAELAKLMKDQPLKLVDVRTREEHDAVKIPHSSLMNESLLQEIFGSWEKESLIVVYDHLGNRSMDAAAYLLGHGFGNTRSLIGGIDAYSRDVDPSLRRYRLEMD